MSGFDNAAHFYDALARLVYGDALQKAQLYLLTHIPDRSRVLVIGGGSGWILKQLILSDRQLSILYVEAAPKMLAKAKRQYAACTTSHQREVTFKLGTEAILQPHEQFDVVITPFLLDLFPPARLQQLMQKLAASLAPAGKWLFADFWPTQNPAPLWQKTLTWAMYTFFGALSGVEARQLPDYAAHFKSLGFTEKASESFYSGFVQAKVYLKALEV